MLLNLAQTYMEISFSHMASQVYMVKALIQGFVLSVKEIPFYSLTKSTSDTKVEKCHCFLVSIIAASVVKSSNQLPPILNPFLFQLFQLFLQKQTTPALFVIVGSILLISNFVHLFQTRFSTICLGSLHFLTLYVA